MAGLCCNPAWYLPKFIIAATDTRSTQLPVIAICSLKGGTGKSTIALNLGSILSEEKRKVLVLDADPNGSIANWQEIRKQDKPEILVEPRPVIHIDKRS